MNEEEHYEALLKDSAAKRRFHDLFQQFPTRIQHMILTKYSGVFNYYAEISEAQLNEICDRLQSALEQEEERLYQLYKDFI